MNKNIKALTRRRELIGAQGVFVHAVIWQPFVMLFTTQTAIARFGMEYGAWAHWFALSVIVASLWLLMLMTTVEAENSMAAILSYNLFLWRRESGSRNRWFCSEAVATALGYADGWRFDPNTLFVVLKGGE